MRLMSRIAICLILFAASSAAAAPPFAVKASFEVTDLEVLMDPDAGLIKEGFEAIHFHYLHYREVDYYELVAGLLWDLNNRLSYLKIRLDFPAPALVYSREGLIRELQRAVCLARRRLADESRPVADGVIAMRLLDSATIRLKGSHNQFLWPQEFAEFMSKYEAPPPFPKLEKIGRPGGRFAIYIKLDEFYFNAIPEALSKLANIDECQGIILDLRDNPGGKVRCVADLGRYFLGPSKLVFKSVANIIVEEYSTPAHHRPGTEKPLVVIVSELSHSGSEIFAYAMKYHKRGLVVGWKTDGFANVGCCFELSNKSAIRVEWGETIMPDGKPIEKRGVVPDVLAYRHDMLDTALRMLEVLESQSKK